MATKGEEDIEVGHNDSSHHSAKPEEAAVDDNSNSNVLVISRLDDRYPGETVETKVDGLIDTAGVVMISRTWCPFCRDALDFLTTQIGVQVHVLHVDIMENGEAIRAHLQSKTNHKTVPMIYIKGEFMGGCDDVKSLHAQGGGLNKLVHDLVVQQRTVGTDRLDTARLVPVQRSVAMNPPFWFPNTVNNRVVRLTGMQVCILSVLSAVFHNELWGRYLAVGLLVDFVIRLLVGSSLSPLGMVATLVTSPLEPVFKPGPPKQFAAFCGTFFSLCGTVFYFVDGFEHHDIVGAAFMAGLAGAAGLEGFLNYCLGCTFYGWGIQYGIFPDYVYRIYTSTRQETIDSWKYKFGESGAPPPTPVDTDPKNPIALKYKKKTDEWTKDDFQLVRNMQVGYFAMPLALAGLAVAFKLSTDKTVATSNNDPRSIVVPELWYQVFATVAAAFFFMFLSQYLVRLIVYPHKCWTEWMCPLRSSSFGIISITFMLFAFLMYDAIKFDLNDANEEEPQLVARILFWMGAVSHTLLTVSKTGEWMGRRLELEHVHPHWMILPVGLAVAGLVAPVVGAFDWYDNSNADDGNLLMARFFMSFAWIMWITLFVVTFFKVVTEHNSDNRIRHGVWIWLAAPCIIGLANYNICHGEAAAAGAIAQAVTAADTVCANEFADYYFMGLFFFMCLCWATLPHLAFFGRDQFGMGYWIECFALDTLAACACQFYALNGFRVSQTLQLMALVAASVCNGCALLHTLVAIVRRRGVFTPEVKWGPLSFMKLTHEAIRGNLDTLKYYLEVIDLDDPSAASQENVNLFAAHFNCFRVLHEEHAKHEDQVIFKTFNDYFAQHAKKWNDDHAQDHVKLERWCVLAEKLLDVSLGLEERKAALEELKSDLPPFFEHFKEHLRGEEDNLNPIGRKHIPLALAKQISCEVWNMTTADKWEMIVPFIVNNLPRHIQRVRYLKVLTWSMPERAQQIGAIVYRNVDSVMWERLRVELPEIIPRGAPGWSRYY